MYRNLCSRLDFYNVPYRFLIEKGADIFRENNAHDLALSFASENGHLEIAQLLVDLGCNPVS